MTTVLIIVGILAVIAFLSGMGDDFWNLVCVAAVLVVSLVLLIAPFFIRNEIFAIFSKAVEEDKMGLYSFLFAMIFVAVGFILGSPLIWAWKEKEYFLILGTLASKTDYTAGLSISIVLGIVFGLPAGFCFEPAAVQTSIWLFIIPGAIATVISLATFIPLIIKYRNEN